MKDLMKEDPENQILIKCQTGMKDSFDENYKTEGGESQVEVRQRMSEAFEEVVKDNKGKELQYFHTEMQSHSFVKMV